MFQKIKALDIVGEDFPPEAGARLAKAILSRELQLDQLEVDLQGLPPSLLISAFFNGFLAVVSEERPELLSKAKRVKLRMDHDFQYENAHRWMRGFQAVH